MGLNKANYNKLSYPEPTKIIRLQTKAHADSDQQLLTIKDFAKLQTGYRYHIYLEGDLTCTMSGGALSTTESIVNIISQIDLDIPGLIKTKNPFSGAEWLKHMRLHGFGGSRHYQPVWPPVEPPADEVAQTIRFRVPLHHIDPFLPHKTGIYAGQIQDTDTMEVILGASSAVDANATVTGTWNLWAVGYPATEVNLHPAVRVGFSTVTGQNKYYSNRYLLRSLAQVGTPAYAESDKVDFLLDGRNPREPNTTMGQYKRLQDFTSQAPVHAQTPTTMVGTIEGVNNLSFSPYDVNVFYYLNPNNRFGDTAFPREEATLDLSDASKEIWQLEYERWTSALLAQLSTRLGKTIKNAQIIADDGKRRAVQLGRDAGSLATGLRA